MTEMLWIVPSRSRPHNVKELISSWSQTRCFADLLIVVDSDDPELPEYRKVIDENRHLPWLLFLVMPRLRLGGTLNAAAKKYVPDYHFIGFMGDDHRPRTQLWDGLMASRLRKTRVGMVYGNDLFQRHNLPTAICMTSNIIETLGYMVPPNMTHLYLDNFWLDLGVSLDCIRYMDNVVIEHVHPHAGKAESDPLYEEVNSNRQNDADRNAYDTYKRKQMESDVEKLQAIL